MNIFKWEDRTIKYRETQMSIAEFIAKYSGKIDIDESLETDRRNPSCVFFMGKKFFIDRNSKDKWYYGRREKKKSGGEYTLRLHELVYMLDHGVLIANDGLMVINHKDNNSLNNRPKNLELVSQKKNSLNPANNTRKKINNLPTGVTYHKKKRIYISRLREKGKDIWKSSSKDKDKVIFMNEILRIMYYDFISE